MHLPMVHTTALWINQGKRQSSYTGLGHSQARYFVMATGPCHPMHELDRAPWQYSKTKQIMA